MLLAHGGSWSSLHFSIFRTNLTRVDECMRFLFVAHKQCCRLSVHLSLQTRASICVGQSSKVGCGSKSYVCLNLQ